MEGESHGILIILACDHCSLTHYIYFKYFLGCILFESLMVLVISFDLLYTLFNLSLCNSCPGIYAFAGEIKFSYIHFFIY